MNKNLLPISKFGLSKIVYSLAFFVLFLILDFDILSFLTFLVVVGLIYVYRNPEREVIIFEKNSIVSPCDGTITSIEELSDSEYAYKITIENDLSDIGVLRVPMQSKLVELELIKGAKTSSKSKLFEKLNENATLSFEDLESNKIKIQHRVKQSFDNIEIDAFNTQLFAQGARYGFMANGFTYLYLPHNFRVNLNVGNQVKASESLVGYFS